MVQVQLEMLIGSVGLERYKCLCRVEENQFLCHGVGGMDSEANWGEMRGGELCGGLATEGWDAYQWRVE